jgi:iron-sulfur cluster repair protein YtfE (RIC family)
MAARPLRGSTRRALQPIESWREGADKVEALAGKVSAALAAGKLAPARRHFAAYQKLLLAHLAREEDVAFPAAEKLVPSQGGPIRSLRVAHIGIRRDLEQISAQLERGHAEAAKAVFAAFLEAFASHERLEDQLVELLQKS